MPFPETSLYLLIGGVAALLLHFIFAIAQVVRHAAPRASWVNAILALVTALATLAALLIDTFSLAPVPAILPVLAVTGAAGFILGGLLLIFERRRGGFSASHSPGLLFLAVSVLIGALTIFIPILPQQFWPADTMLAQVVSPTFSSVAVQPSVTPSPRPSTTLAPSITPTPSPTHQPTSEPSPTATRERYSTRTPTPTPPVERVCGAVVDYNLNLRREASTNADIILVIPFSSIVAVGGRDADSEWWFIEYNDEWGWVMSEYITVEALCEAAPIVE